MIVTEIGLDGHDRGSRIVAAACRDAGMEVIYTPPWQTIAAVVKLALEEDVDVVGISSLATDHLIVPKLMNALRDAGLANMRVVVGGIVPDNEEALLLSSGVRRVFHPGSRWTRSRPRSATTRARHEKRPMRACHPMNKPIKPDLLPSHPPTPRPPGSATTPDPSAPSAKPRRLGRPIRPLYGPEDWAAYGQGDPLGFPGQPDYTRGIYATMHRGRTWTQRQLIGLGTPADYNARLLEIMARGANAVSLIPCNSVYRGYDMDSVSPSCSAPAAWS